MNRNKVNRFTFDAHSVVLFSALVLASTGASAAATQRAQSASVQQTTAVTSSHTARNPNTAPLQLVAQTKRRNDQ